MFVVLYYGIPSAQLQLYGFVASVSETSFLRQALSKKT